jgi:ribonuclease H, mammalian HI/archaeal HII subfamily
LNDRIICGVDDAGRGCIFGPLFIAGAAMSDDVAKQLYSDGVRDSKLLTRQQRERLFDVIREKAISYVVLSIKPEEIDEYVRRKKKHTKLNYLEAIYMARAINKLQGEVAYVDASDTDVRVFSAQIEENLERKLSIVAVHHADRLFPVVSAASILAKVSRDREIEKLKKEVGDFGSGYPSDPRTVKFLKEWIASKKSPPPFTRLSWKTWKKLLQIDMKLE